MDEKTFKKHLADLIHGHHHPDEHDWENRDGEPGAKGESDGAGSASKRAPAARRKPPTKARSSRTKRKSAGR